MFMISLFFLEGFTETRGNLREAAAHSHAQAVWCLSPWHRVWRRIWCGGTSSTTQPLRSLLAAASLAAEDRRAAGEVCCQCSASRLRWRAERAQKRQSALKRKHFVFRSILDWLNSVYTHTHLEECPRNSSEASLVLVRINFGSRLFHSHEVHNLFGNTKRLFDSSDESEQVRTKEEFLTSKKRITRGLSSFCSTK